MRKERGEQLIGRRWIVEGIYTLWDERKRWERSGDYKQGNVVWQFERLEGVGVLTAHLNGRVDYIRQFSIIYGKLFIAPTVEKPDLDCSGSRESYMIVEKPDGIWLYDLKNKTADGRWQALKLILAK